MSFFLPPLAARPALLALLAACLAAVPLPARAAEQERFDSEVAGHLVADASREAVLAKAASEQKPIWLLVMRSRCRSAACLTLRGSVNGGQRVRQLMTYFVVAVPEEDEAQASWLGQERGGDVPKSRFYRSAGEPLPVDGLEEHALGDDDALAEVMMKALKLVGVILHFNEKFNDDIAKHFSKSIDPEKVREAAHSAGKPMLVLIMTRWCHACLTLRYSVNHGKEVRSLLDKFFIVYVEGYGGKTWEQEGHGYIPQAHFFTYEGQRLAVHASPNYHYFFGDDATLAYGMKKALKLTGNSWKNWFTSDFENDLTNQLTLTSDPDEVHKVASDEGKPLMVVVTQPWCPVCRGLIKSINAGTRVRELVPSFTFCHAREDKVALTQWQEKGEYYVPQAYFWDKSGKWLERVHGPNQKFKRYFENENQLADAMKEALILAHQQEL